MFGLGAEEARFSVAANLVLAWYKNQGGGAGFRLELRVLAEGLQNSDYGGIRSGHTKPD